MAITGSDFGSKLVELWGWKNCRNIEILIPCAGIVTIQAEFNCTDEQAKEITALVRQYKLVEKEQCAIS